MPVASSTITNVLGLYGGSSSQSGEQSYADHVRQERDIADLQAAGQLQQSYASPFHVDPSQRQTMAPTEMKVPGTLYGEKQDQGALNYAKTLSLDARARDEEIAAQRRGRVAAKWATDYAKSAVAGGGPSYDLGYRTGGVDFNRRYARPDPQRLRYPVEKGTSTWAPAGGQTRQWRRYNAPTRISRAIKRKYK